MTPEQAAQRRAIAIEELQATLSRQVDESQRLLLEGLLNRLEDTLADPMTIPALLAEYAATVAAPLAVAYGQSLLKLPGLSGDYFASLGLTNYRALRAPAESFLRQRFGINPDGSLVPGGELFTLATDVAAQRTIMRYAYTSLSNGTGLTAYRKGLEQLVLGDGSPGDGLIQGLYKASYDDYNKADRVLQQAAAKELGLSAFLYQGGLIATSRPFCVVRNGKVFTDFEIAKFGTKKDAYEGYSNKSKGLFSGKPDPYTPMQDCGGYGCRHGLSAVPNLVALRMRPDLMETADGKLMLRP